MCPVARRHGLTPQQMFTWRRLARKPAEVLSVPRENPMFAPAVVVSPEKPEPKKARPAHLPRKNSSWPPAKARASLCDERRPTSASRDRPSARCRHPGNFSERGSAARAAFTGADREYRNADRCSRIRRYPYLAGGAFLRGWCILVEMTCSSRQSHYLVQKDDGDRGNRSGVRKLGDEQISVDTIVLAPRRWQSPFVSLSREARLCLVSNPSSPLVIPPEQFRSSLNC
ncbi:transposase [Rhizobium leguminosarum]|nr:transposase [Rhizobium leguminosarum]